jgi:hypothetical protein
MIRQENLPINACFACVLHFQLPNKEANSYKLLQIIVRFKYSDIYSQDSL